MPYKIKKVKKGYKVLVRGKPIPGTSRSKSKAQSRIRAIGMRTHGN